MSADALKFDVIVVDPPWKYYGDPNKMGAAGKEYACMTFDQIASLPITKVLSKNGAVFCWATSPKLADAIKVIESWGLAYRGVAFVWVKTRQSDNQPIHGQGVRPSFTKPTSEYLLVASRRDKGRPLKLHKENVPQVVLHSRGAHSQKPEIFQTHIESMYPGVNMLELFARRRREGWTCVGDEIGSDVPNWLVRYAMNGWA